MAVNKVFFANFSRMGGRLRVSSDQRGQSPSFCWNPPRMWRVSHLIVFSLSPMISCLHQTYILGEGAWGGYDPSCHLDCCGNHPGQECSTLLRVSGQVVDLWGLYLGPCLFLPALSPWCASLPLYTNKPFLPMPSTITFLS